MGDSGRRKLSRRYSDTLSGALLISGARWCVTPKMGYGQVIPGLYCGGESAGGFSLHGVARAACQGFIAGTNTTAEKPRV